MIDPAPPETSLASPAPWIARLVVRAALLGTAIAWALGVAGCSRESASTAAATSQPADTGPVIVQLAGKPFRLEVAATDATRQLGLMFRKSLAEDAGMVFVFRYQQPLSFWMKNTEIPLDILYIDGRGEIVSIKQMAPFDLNGVPSDLPARYAIELNKGTAAKLGLKVGDVIALPPRIKDPPELD